MRFKPTRIAIVLALMLVPVTVLSGTAQAAPDHTRTLTTTTTTVSWTGAAPTLGSNGSFNSTTGAGTCPDVPSDPLGGDYCEQALIHVNTPSPVTVDITLTDDPTNDFDFFVYRSDAAGIRGNYITFSAESQTLGEIVTLTNASGYYLAIIVYFATAASGYDAQATITSPPGGPATDLPQTIYYLHEDGPPFPPVDNGFFNTTAPTATSPSVANGSQGLGFAPQPRWDGTIPNGRIRRLKVDFWQRSTGGPAFGNTYEITLIDGANVYEFPFVEGPINTQVPGRFTFQFEEGDTNVPLPLVTSGGPITIQIAGHFSDGESTFEIYYDSVTEPSNFVVNPPPLPPPHDPFPADVDNPPGLQEVLASDPALGFRSRSEMHIAQNPVNPNYLVAASKFYNKDLDSLAQYEFKIGTYISFDRGRSWTDLGQARVCPAGSLGSGSPGDPGLPGTAFPNNTCYPEDDPNANDDVGEQYITSDPWVGWDDEGNAYLMVLDSAPFGLTENGWGMTLHRWDSVSPADVPGSTWGPRLPISSYNTPNEQQLFLDDKNTFAVNNAGPDGDNQTGPIVACWGKNIPDAIKQAEVCKRSTDKGQTWSQEIPINDVEQLGIGVNVVADPNDPMAFYATYLQYLTSTGEVGPATMEFNRSLDGGLTWLPASTTVATLDDIETNFPGQKFRNLSIPIMAAGNLVQTGSVFFTELYITWAEDRLIGAGPAKESEIVIVRSDNEGVSWNGFGTPPNHVKIVNGPDSNRSQFQPYVAVAPSGQVNVFYFDRRDQPDNYFVDSYLSRSNNRGGTFTDHRLSHDATDPELNAPTDSAGNAFFGDYQGLTVDNCFAYPFVNDTHLAMDILDPQPGPRDPDFDHTPALPDSLFQEAVSWRVPNTTAFGGTMSLPCGADLAITKDGPAGRAPTGRNMTYTLTVTNNGPDPAADVVVTDTLPAVTFVSATPSQGSCNQAAGIVTCNLGALGNLASATITIVVKPTQAGQITNVATVTASTEDAIAANNSASVQTTVCRITSRPTSIPCP